MKEFTALRIFQGSYSHYGTVRYKNWETVDSEIITNFEATRQETKNT